MPTKHRGTERLGGPGAAHQNRQQPVKSRPRGPHPLARKSASHSGVSGGGGEPDRNHAHRAPAPRRVRSAKRGIEPAGNGGSGEATIKRGFGRESDHNKHNERRQRGHGPQKHTPAEEKKHR